MDNKYKKLKLKNNLTKMIKLIIKNKLFNLISKTFLIFSK